MIVGSSAPRTCSISRNRPGGLQLFRPPLKAIRTHPVCRHVRSADPAGESPPTPAYEPNATSPPCLTEREIEVIQLRADRSRSP
jgi:hypothetical protein